MDIYAPESLREIIPVGGEAKRLRPLTAESSKACVRLVNRPLIEIALLCLAMQGVRTFIFGVKGYTNYKSLHDYFQDGTGFSARYGISPRVHIKYQPRIEDFGSADSARINIEYYDVNDPVFGVQGDNIFNIDLRDFLEFHQKKEAFMTIGLIPVEDVEGYGIADIDQSMRISRFVEKPRREDSPSNLANAGLYLLTPEVRNVLREEGVDEIIANKRRLDFGYDLIPYLIRTGRAVYGYTLKGCWYDVGTPERYLDAMHAILQGRLECLKEFEGRIFEDRRVWVEGGSPASALRREEILKKVRAGKVELEGTVLMGRHCQLGDGVRIVNSCIDNFTKIGEDVTIEGSAVMDRVVIGDGAMVMNSIIGRHTVVDSTMSKPTRISSVSVIGDDVTIGEECRMTATRVYPHMRVPSGAYVKKTLMM